MAERELKNPWVGLRPFQPADSEVFFGRERETQTISDLVATLPVLVVYAPSGTGKSSLLNAGLAPDLDEDRSQLAVLIADSSHDVFERTREAIRASGWEAQPAATDLAELMTRHRAATKRRIVVVVDQLEERFNAGVATDALFDAIAQL